ncbi:AsmA family protein [Reyranella sp. CPCC 100927]|uniref:AsmA family protein n=1 Tax=Reyranella sp. CPCC 100927 TaxID=2599616 RepID=UPI0011B42661|nr:AsmA family protein [Reyranella sp. CPCC 100927]TWT02024.1 AsmA family protein [Reyranella sp. CPCC 100927]
MKKILIGVGGVVAFLVVAALAVPFLVDPNIFKPQIIASAKEATGRDLVIDGPLKLSILPFPSVSAEGVRFANTPGAKTPQMVELKSVRAGVAVLPLLSRRIEISELRLVEPRIVIEVGPDGRANYDFKRGDGTAPPPPAVSTPGNTTTASDGSKFSVAISRVVIERGALTYSDAVAKREYRLERMDLTLSAASLQQGPFAAAGSLTVNGVLVNLDGKVGAKAANGVSVDLMIKTADGEARLNGTVSELTPAARFTGTAKLAAGDLAAFIRGLAMAAVMPRPDLPAALARKVSFEGAIEASAEAFSARDFRLAMGDDQGSGTLAVALKPATRIDGKLSFTKLDLDKWRPADEPAQTPARPAPGTGRPAAVPTAPGTPANLSVKLVLDAAEVTYNGAAIRKLLADVALENGQLAVRRIEALLPGNAQLAGTMAAGADGKYYSGDVSLAGPKLRETLNWLKVDVAQVPADKLAAFSFKGKLQSAQGNALAISDATVQLDGMTARGGATVAVGAPMRITADFQADTIDVDAYLPKKAAAGTGNKPAAGPPAGKPAAPSAASAPPALDARIKAKVARIVYNGERIEGVDADVTYRDGRLTFGDTRIGSVAGASVAVKGSVANLTATPSFDLSVNVQTSDADRLLKLAGASSPVKGPLGTVSLQGGVGGTAADLVFKDFTIHALGATLKMTGKVTPAAGNPRYDLSAFSFQTNDLDKLLSALGNDKAGNGMGAVSASGAAKGDTKTVAFNGNFTAKGVRGDGSVTAALGGQVPRITANLKTSELNIDQLTGQGGGQPAAAGGPQGGSGGGRHSKAPINLAFLKGIEADVDIASPVISKAPWRLENAVLKASLKGGVLTITRLAGGVYGGTIDLSGTVSAVNNSFDARLAASNINVGTAARALGDTKRVDGVVTVNLTLNGSLASTADIMSSLNGDGKVSGNVRFNASVEEQLGGKLAGSALKGLGKRLDKLTGGTGAGDELGDLRAALKVANERFANRTGPVSGTIAIRNGNLHTKDLRVDGNRAWAITEADINLPAWTMVAITNVFVEESPQAPYVIVKQKGPVDSPSRSVDRGPAAASVRPQGQPDAQQPGAAPQPPQQQQPKPTDPLKKLKKIF